MICGYKEQTSGRSLFVIGLGVWLPTTRFPVTSTCIFVFGLWLSVIRYMITYELLGYIFITIQCNWVNLSSIMILNLQQTIFLLLIKPWKQISKAINSFYCYLLAVHIKSDFLHQSVSERCSITQYIIRQISFWSNILWTPLEFTNGLQFVKSG